MDLEISNIHECCRICLQGSQEEEVFEIDEQVIYQFLQITQTKLEQSEQLPNIICKLCVDELQKSYDFRAKIIKYQEKLTSFIEGNCREDEEEAEQVELKLDKKNVEIIYEVIEESYEEPIQQKATHVDSCASCNLKFSSHQLFEDHNCSNVIGEIMEVEIEDFVAKKKVPRKRLETPIKCSECDREFYYKSYLQFHFNDVHVIKSSICPQCGKQFKNSRRLNSHILTHTNSKKFSCKVCSKEFNFSGDLKRHHRIHTSERPYQCEQCPKNFKQSYALTLHTMKHENIRYKCDLCGTSEFSCKPSLKKHMVNCLNGTNRIRKVPTYNYGERTKYKCFVENCEKVYTSRRYLKLHLEKEHDKKLANFDTTCLECQSVFETVGEYSVHVKTHSCNFVCEICMLRFKSNEKKVNHQLKFHKNRDEERPFKCDICSATFKRTEHHKAHMLYKHSDIRNYTCEICFMKFRQQGEFTIHQRRHTNSKPFKCSNLTCDYESKTSSNLRQHAMIVHGTDNIYLCGNCPKSFKYLNEQQQHKRECTASVVKENEAVSK